MLRLSEVISTLALSGLTRRSRPMAAGSGWSTSLIWGRNHDTFTQHNLNSYLLETAYPLPSAIKPYYGDRPWGVNVYVRLRLKPIEK
jgi:hypothetical protein